MDDILTDEQKLESWVDLVEFHNFFKDRDGNPLPAEFKEITINQLESNEISFTDHGSVVCESSSLNNKIIVPNNESAKILIDGLSNNYILLLYNDLITNRVITTNIESLYVLWVKFVNRMLDSFNFTVPHKLLPNFFINDNFKLLEKALKEVS